MYTFFRIPFLLGALSLLSVGCFSGFASKPVEISGKATGELSSQSRVGVRHQGRVVLAEVLKVEGDSYEVKLTTGSTRKVAKSEILPIAAPGTLKTGDRVLAPRERVELWMADLVRIEGDKAVVIFNNSSEEERVPLDQVALLPPGLCEPGIGCTGSGAHQTDTGGGKGVEAPVATDPYKALQQSFKIGDKVILQGPALGNSNNHDWLVGTVAGRMGDTLLIKLPGEAEPKNGFASDLRPLRAPKRPLASGVVVLFPNGPDRFLEAWIASGPDPEGKFAVFVKRGVEGGSPAVEMSLEELAGVKAYAPEDF